MRTISQRQFEEAARILEAVSGLSGRSVQITENGMQTADEQKFRLLEQERDGYRFTQEACRAVADYIRMAAKNKDLKMMFSPHPPEHVFDADGNKYVLCRERENE